MNHNTTGTHRERNMNCSLGIRGRAVWVRQFGAGRVMGSETRRACNGVIHCNSKKKNCPATRRFIRASKASKKK